MVLWERPLLHTYWYWLTTVARTGGYYGATFKGYRGVTQGGALSLTIFNVVLYLMVRHWVYLVTEGEEVKEKLGREVQIRAIFLYVDDGLINLTHPEWLQGMFDSLMGMFDQLVIKKMWGIHSVLFVRPSVQSGHSRRRHTNAGLLGQY